MSNVFRSGRNGGPVTTASLDGQNGFRLPGWATEFGDVNGDGVLDLGVGSYVLFGGPSSGMLQADPATLDGSNGFHVDGSLVLADLNHDGFSDVVVEGPLPLLGQPSPRYVIWGRADYAANEPSSSGPPVTTSILNKLEYGVGAYNPSGGGPSNGQLVSLGDFNGDGYADLNIGAFEQYYRTGRWVQPDGMSFITGGAGWEQRDQIASDEGVNLPTGSAIIRLGDLNGDGRGDLGVLNRDRLSLAQSSSTAWDWQILYGSATSDIPSVTLSQGVDQNAPGYTRLRPLGRIGDVNGDGREDLLLQTHSVRYVLFGGANLDPLRSPDTLDGTHGFRLPRLSEGAPFPLPGNVGAATGGDFNGDGYSDIALADGRANGDRGVVYVIWGRAQFPAAVGVSNTEPESYFRIDNPNQTSFGADLHAADVNGDGVDDLLAMEGDWDSTAITHVFFGTRSYGLTSGADTHYGTANDEQVDGLAGDDAIYGQAGADHLLGNSGNDNLYGGLGADILDGGEGQDFVRFDDASYAGFTVSFADFSLNTGPAAGDEYLYTEGLVLSSGDDTAYGDSQDNAIKGMGGDDRLHGALGADALNGGDGYDYAAYADDNYPGFTVSLASPVLNTGVAAGDTFTSIEGLILGSGHDTGYGDNNANALYGLDGNDMLFGALGGDLFDGGDGFDYVSFADADYAGFTVSMTAPSLGTGPASGDAFANIEGLIASGGNDWIYGNTGANYLYGLAGNDNLFGSLGADHLHGGAGFDYARFDDASYGALMADLSNTVAGTGAAAGDIYTEIEGLILTGFGDTAYGNAGDNYLYGLGGNDTLNGRGGNDSLYGGLGIDTFVFDSALGANNVDTIGDFTAGADKIQLENAIFAALTAAGGLNAGNFRSGAGITTSGDADDHVIFDTTTGALYYDADGNGSGSSAVQWASVVGSPALSADDFLVT